MRNRVSMLAVLGLLVAAFMVQMPVKAATGSFVLRNGVNLTLDGRPYGFTGINIYNANSTNNHCVIRAWFFQSLATSNSARDWTAFDRTIATAKSLGVRVIATLANQWVD